VDNNFTYLEYKDTGFFSRLVTDYLGDKQEIKPFYGYAPDATGLAKAIDERCKFPVNRQVLVGSLSRQYQHLAQSPETAENINSLLRENTFTVCTAHQPNLLTGYLYFIYKILHAIKLAEQLNALHPDKHFVPVYYMGSEDNDLEELGTFRFRSEKYAWDGSGQTGAVGRMATSGLKHVLDNLFKLFGPPGKNCTDLREMISNAYLKHKTIADATQYLVNELFGRYGLVVLNPDDASLKATFIPVMEDELLHQNALPVIARQIALLGENYKIQAHPRPINLFDLSDQLRERIEQQGENWIVVNTNINWTKDEMLAELRQHPERFSPNVMLRGLYQETILPDVAFIGGGAEVAYWLQLKALFGHYNIFYPNIHLRQSVLCIPANQSKLRQQLEFSIADIFQPELQLVKEYIARHTENEWQTNGETTAIETIFQNLKQKATAVDATLSAASEAVLVKMKRQLAELEKKMLRAEKKKMQVQMDRINRLKTSLFPSGSLQERVENFMEYYLEYGPQFLDSVKDGIEPLHPKFLVIE
jgi:bacillithiol biosynthesis cysteine-adding enzyme BshC